MRILGCVSYKGTNYQGWQKQVNAKTVQEEIEKVLSKILNKQTNIQGSGRTDAGVHAQNQYFHFDVDKELDLEKFRYSVNCLLPNDIYVNFFKIVSDDFHARYNAKEKTYSYLIRFNERNPFNYEYEATIPMEIDIDLLSKALKLFEGIHNFKDFNSKEEDDENFIREVYSAKLQYVPESKQGIITFIGNGFMRYQIRYMVGTALAVAQHKEDISFITNHLDDEKAREIVNYKAPAEGLYLIDVKY